MSTRGDGARENHDTPFALGPRVARAATRQVVQRLIIGLESRITVADWPDDRDKHLRTLDILVQARDDAQARIDELVPLARKAGASWADIGRVIRLTRQAAHSRYRRKA